MSGAGRFTVLGGGGFIGGHVVRRLRAEGREVMVPERDAPLDREPLGRVIYCIGLTADFRRRPFDTVEAHVCKLNALLRSADFESLVYLSSTRVYGALPEGSVAAEETPLSVESQSGSDLYNLSKLMGESIALHSGRPCAVARLSNVYGDDRESDNFLAQVLRQAAAEGRVEFRTSPDSAKDYLHVAQAAEVLVRISLQGRGCVYNIASGTNVTNAEIAEWLAAAGVETAFAPGAPRVTFPPLSNDRIRQEFGFRPWRLLDRLGDLYQLYRENS